MKICRSLRNVRRLNVSTVKFSSVLPREPAGRIPVDRLAYSTKSVGKFVRDPSLIRSLGQLDSVAGCYSYSVEKLVVLIFFCPSYGSNQEELQKITEG